MRYLVLALKGRRGHERLGLRLLLRRAGIRPPRQADLGQLGLDLGHVPYRQPAVGQADGQALAVRAQGRHQIGPLSCGSENTRDPVWELHRVRVRAAQPPAVRAGSDPCPLASKLDTLRTVRMSQVSTIPLAVPNVRWSLSG